MGPFSLSVMVNDSAISLPDTCTKRKQNLLLKNSFASVSMGDEKPFDFLRILFEGVIAGGTAGVVVETALYPIDTIKTRLQAGCSRRRKTNIEGPLFRIGREPCWCLTVRTSWIA
ncbi:S-adenosylmethionine carrier 1, chloroplastic/mitochondrial [Glycine soja]